MTSRKLFVATLSLALMHGAFAETNGNPDTVIKQVRKANMQKIAAERAYQTISTLKGTAEDLAAIRDLGFKIDDEGALVEMTPEERRARVSAGWEIQDAPMQSAGTPTNSMAMPEDGMSNGVPAGEIGFDTPSIEKAPKAEPQISFAGSTPKLIALSTDSAVFIVDGKPQRAFPGDPLPGGFTLKEIKKSTAVLLASNGTTRRVKIDWSKPEEKAAPTDVPPVIGQEIW